MSKRYQGGVLGVGFNPLRAPNAPTIGTATAGGNNCASVPFTAPACVGGSAITGYTARSDPAGFSGTAAASPFAVTGLTSGTSYTFGVFALNSYGPSPSSAFSNSITAVLDGTLRYGAAAGNSTRGIFALGQNGCGVRTTTRNKYTYSGDTNATGGAASQASENGAASGNSTVGIFALGYVNGSCRGRDKYTYASCVVSSGTQSTATTCGGSSSGNSSVGIFSLGNSTTTRNKYTYATDTNAAATSASVAGDGDAASNGISGVTI
jgi:hypothetical protein